MQGIQGLAPQCPFWAEVAGRGEGLERLCWWACWRSWGGESRRHHWLPGVACRPPEELRELLDRSCRTRKSARGKNAYGLLYKLSKKTGLGIKCLDLFYECSSHRLHSIENLFCSVLDS
jgi:hypothetical protein